MEPFRSSTLLNQQGYRGWRSRPKLLALSVALHALFPIGLLLLPMGVLKRDHEPERVEIVFYSPEEKSPEVPPPLEIVEPEPRPEPKPKPKPKPKPRPRPEPELQRKPEPRLTPAPPVVVPEALPEPAPAAPPRRELKTGGFAATEVVAPEQPSARPAAAKLAGFGSESGDAKAPVGKTNARVVAAGRFADGDLAIPRPGKSAPRGAVTTAGFADGAAVAADEPGNGKGSVQQGGFGDGPARAAEPRARQRKIETFDTPVEIVQKPRPDYTDEARKLRIEGDVVLEVTFVASGRLRVLRVVGGLGHGLDEEAVKAAERIRFKPALRNGQPIDHTAKLRVVFRLA